MRAIELKRNESLTDAFGIPRGVTALVGGGGKTTLMLRLAKELAGKGNRVIVTTTTHIFPPDGMTTLTHADVEAVRRALERESPVCVGTPAKEGKLSAPALMIGELALLADYVLAEADGAKKHPLKAPAAHEPVIPAQTALVIAVAGMDGIGKPIAEAAFRPALYAALLGTDEAHAVTPADAARVLTHPSGQRKSVTGGMRFAVLLNKADDAARRRMAQEAAAAIEQETAERVVIAALNG